MTSFANRISVFVWGFAFCWIGMLLAFTWIFVRDGAPEGIPNEGMAAILGFFWLGGLGLANHAMNSPSYWITVDSKRQVSLTWQYPHRRVSKTYPASLLGLPTLFEYRDSDGDPYFRTRLTLPDGSFIDIAEGHDRDDCESARDRFMKAVAA